jgi:hypothetical protein
MPQGHIFLPTDLFLICGRILATERAAYGPDGPGMFLCYPPLAGKHLIVSDVAGPPSGGCISTVFARLVLPAKNFQAPPPMPPPYAGPASTIGNRSPINGTPRPRPAPAPMVHQRRRDHLPHSGGFGPSPPDPRPHVERLDVPTRAKRELS